MYYNTTLWLWIRQKKTMATPIILYRLARNIRYSTIIYTLPTASKPLSERNPNLVTETTAVHSDHYYNTYRLLSQHNDIHILYYGYAAESGRLAATTIIIIIIYTAVVSHSLTSSAPRIRSRDRIIYNILSNHYIV